MSDDEWTLTAVAARMVRRIKAGGVSMAQIEHSWSNRKRAMMDDMPRDDKGYTPDPKPKTRTNRVVGVGGTVRDAPTLMVVYRCPRCDDDATVVLDAYAGVPSCSGGRWHEAMGTEPPHHVPTFLEPIRLATKVDGQWV